MMMQIIQIISVVSVVFFLFILIMSFALLRRVDLIKRQQGILDWNIVHIVDLKTSRGCSAEDLIQYFRRSFRGLLSVVGILGIAIYYTKQNPFSINPVYASIFMGVFLFSGWLMAYSIVMSSNLIINNLVNRFRQ